MNISRRDAFKWGVGASGMLMLPWASPKKALAQALPDYPSQRDLPFPYPHTNTFFNVDLPIPPVLEPVQSNNTTDFYYIVMQKAQMNIQGFQAPVKTNIWSYTGITSGGHLTPVIPGPTIRQKQDRLSVIRFVNGLGDLEENDIPGDPWPIKEPINTVVHLHGMASKPQYDGYAVDYICPYYYKDYHYPNNRSATIWYHDHTLDRTRRNVAMGLAGMFIVYDDFELQNLPSGDYDIPLVFQSYPDPGGETAYNGAILINGAYQARLKVKAAKYRFRLLNATATQSLFLNLLQVNGTYSGRGSAQFPGPLITVIGTDAGLVERPVTTTQLRIGMGERYEFLIDFSHYYSDDSPNNNYLYLVTQNQNEQYNSGYGTTTPLLLFEITGPDDQPPVNIPATLRPYNRIPESDATTTVKFVYDFSRNVSGENCVPPLRQIATINGKAWDTQRVDANPGLAEIQTWILKNNTPIIHPIHIHLVDLQMISRNGLPPMAYEDNWKDVFFLGPYDEVKVIAKFGPSTGKYMMHCHNLLHEDCAMMTQFEVGQGGPSPCSAPAQPLDQRQWNLLGIQGDYEQFKQSQLSNPCPNGCDQQSSANLKE